MSAYTQENVVEKNKKKFPALLVITENGYAKHSYLGDFRKTARRGTGGVKTLNITSKTGKPVLVLILQGQEESLIVTTKNGVTIRIPLASVPQLGRGTQGVRIIRLDKDDSVVSGTVN